jgi:hypothetical protein
MTRTPLSADELPRGLFYAFPVIGFVLVIFTCWFAVADRYRVFLYYHDMGSQFPDTSPFSAVTSSRYCMTGFVASGFVLVLYNGVVWLWGRIASAYCPPAGWRVWVLCVPALLVTIPAITMSANEPTLPLGIAMKTAIVTLVGLAFALAPGPLAARRPRELVWNFLDGGALALILTGAIGLEEMGGWLADGVDWRVVLMFTVMLAAALGLLVLTALRAWRRVPVSPGRTLFISALTVAYLVLPFTHHVIGTNGYFYITDSGNFLADNAVIQLLIWAGAAAIAHGITRLRSGIAARQLAEPSGG